MRYALLVILNIPIIVLALVNFVTQYKLNKIDKRRFRRQMVVWITILVVLICSFPIYNLSVGLPLLQSDTLDLFDVFQTTAIIYMIFFINNQHRKIEQNERFIRDLHQELSIKLSTSGHEKTKR